nr:MAG TPA: Protein of unknown function (DUF2634) [Caudoviricetes sp.]
MRSDFELDSDGWDLVITDDIGIVENAAMTSQDSKFSLQLIQGEVFDDNRIGMPWLTDMVSPQVSIAAKKQIIRDIIMTTPGAIEITRLEVVVDNESGIASAVFEGITDNRGAFGSSIGRIEPKPPITNKNVAALNDYLIILQ